MALHFISQRGQLLDSILISCLAQHREGKSMEHAVSVGGSLSLSALQHPEKGNDFGLFCSKILQLNTFF